MAESSAHTVYTNDIKKRGAKLRFKYFRDIMDTWDEVLFEQEEIEGKINSLLDGQDNILFFKKGGDIFGASEDSRIVFAKLKTPDDEEDLPSGWDKEANFDAWNLTKGLQSAPSHQLFSKKDLKGIKVIDRDTAFDELKDQAENMDDVPEPTNALQIITVKKPQEDPAKAPNFVQADEED